MRRRTNHIRAAAAAAALLAAGCGSSRVVERPATAPESARQLPSPPAPTPPPTPQADPIGEAIARSQGLFERGRQEVLLGHLAQAKALFDQALDSLLELPEGARSVPRLREHFDRLVDRISAYEIRALAEGDGFAERPTVPASLDELLDLSTFELPAPPPSLREAVESDLRSTVHDVPIPLNSKVLSYIDLFQGRLRDWFQTALQRGAPYLPMIHASLRAEGLPSDLAFVPIVESAFRADALSRAKAKGFWQLMRGTGVEQGLKYDWYLDERSDPEKSTAAAVKYLKRLNGMFDGDWHLALASYNGGPGTVQRAVKRKGRAEFWPLAEGRRYLPRETREYVPMVLASMVIARNPEHYGFSLTRAEPPASDSVTVTGPVDLRRVSEWAGVPTDEVQRLNPELRRLTTPVKSDPFILKVPAGTGATVSQRLADLQPEEVTSLQWHTVRKGETLQSVANKLKVRRTNLAEANYLKPTARLRPGQRLVIPREPTTLLATGTGRPEQGLAPARPATDAVPAAAPASNPNAEPTRVTYRVRRGDTLSSIARSFRTTVAALRSWNGLKSDRLMPGDRLTVYTTRPTSG
jgi:membrane-bound lytic murein transglycosylase D